jgi:hypothetical protein
MNEWKKRKSGFKSITSWWNEKKRKAVFISHVRKGVWTVGKTGEYPILTDKKSQALKVAKKLMEVV